MARSVGEVRTVTVLPTLLMQVASSRRRFRSPFSRKRMAGLSKSGWQPEWAPNADVALTRSLPLPHARLCSLILVPS